MKQPKFLLFAFLCTESLVLDAVKFTYVRNWYFIKALNKRIMTKRKACLHKLKSRQIQVIPDLDQNPSQHINKA